MRTMLSPQDAFAKAVAIVKSHNVRGMTPNRTLDDGSDSSNYLSVEFRRAWSCDVNLYVKIDRDSYKPQTIPALMGRSDPTLYFTYKASIEISTSGTSRSLAETQVLLSTLADVQALAAELTAALNADPIAERYESLEEVK